MANYGRLKGVQYIQLMSSYSPAWGFGGPIRLMYEYARWIANMPSSVTVITGDVHHNFSRIGPSVELIDDVHIIRVPVIWRSLARRNINLVSPKMLLIAIRLVRSWSGRVIIHFCELRGLVPAYAVILKSLFPRKVLLVHSAFGMLHHKQSMIRKVYDRILLRPTLHSLDLALAQNGHEVACYKNYFTEYGERSYDSIAMFPLHVSVPKSNGSLGDESVESHRVDLRKRYKLPPNAFTLLFLGRLNRAKGIERAIDAYLVFSREHNGNTFFLIVGRDEGMHRRILEYINQNGASSHIRIVTDVYEERFEYYTLADLFLGFPTIYEETMLASVEALSSGTPVLVSREADIPFVEEEGAGFVIDFTVESAADRIHRIAAQAHLFRKQALSVAKAHFSETAARHNFITIFDEYAGRSGGHAP